MKSRHVREGTTARVEGAAILTGALAVLSLWAAPAGLTAQETGPEAGTVSLDAKGGVGIPVDSDGLDAILKTGASFGGGVSVHVTRAVALTADVTYQIMEGDVDAAGIPFPDMDILHATGGVEVHFLDPETRWTGAVSVGAGISNLDTSEALTGGAPSPLDVSVTNLSFRGGAQLGYQASSMVDVFLEPGVYLIALDREDTRVFSDASVELDEPFDVGWIIPIEAGLRVKL